MDVMLGSHFLIRLVNAASAELLTVVLVLMLWALWTKFVLKKKQLTGLKAVTLFGFFWIVAIVIHLAVFTGGDHNLSIFRPATASTNTLPDKNDVETLRANKEKLENIIIQVIRGRKVDQQTHEAFWDLIPSSLRHNPRFINGLNRNTNMKYQRAFWESILISIRNHQVVKTEKLDELLPKMPASVKHKAAAMLRAAATGKPYTLSNGRGKILLTVATAKRAIVDFDRSEASLESLFNPSWPQNVGPKKLKSTP